MVTGLYRGVAITGTWAGFVFLAFKVDFELADVVDFDGDDFATADDDVVALLLLSPDALGDEDDLDVATVREKLFSFYIFISS